LPSETAEFVELWAVPFASRIPLDKIQSLDWNIEARAFCVCEEHELAHIAASTLESGGHVSGWSASGGDPKPACACEYLRRRTPAHSRFCDRFFQSNPRRHLTAR